MPSPRSAALTAVFVAVMLLVVTGASPWSPAAQAHRALSAPSAARAPSPDSVEKLRKQADKAKEDLAKATNSWEQRQKQLVSSEAKLKQTLADLGAADAETNKIREPLARLAAIAYKQPGVIGMPALLSGGDPVETLRTTTDLSMLSGSQQALVRRADSLRKQRETLAAVAQDLQSRNALERTRLKQEIDRLKSRSDALTKQLTAALKKLDPSTRLQLTCKESLVSRAREFPNGLIPSRYLCPLPQRGRYLRADAALAFYQLNRAYKARFGTNMCLTDAYRPLGEQQRIYANRPGMAAVPGKSNHGWGTAVDLCGGVQNQGSAQFGWLEANGRKYEWFHPSWAYSSPFEPWHWEYTKQNTSNG